MRFTDSFMKKLEQGIRRLSLKFSNNFKKMAEGEIFCRIKEDGVTKHFSLGKNIVTLDASILLARLMKDSTEPAAGVSFFALGTGSPSWDKFNPPAPDPTQHTLVTEIFRVAPSRAVFIDPDTGLESVDPTNIVDFDFDFAESEAVGYLVEAGLFGGDATSTINTGTLITNKTFPVISKTSTMSLSFTYRLTF
jgi:hypothetical protein